ncbi:MAG: metal ABC transporter permease [Firmicutes bacterium]|nr:metal ABC transporter permease [Bacillota bacterium]
MLKYAFMQNALLCSICISVLCPCIGVFLVLRKYALIGDTLAHSSLAGVAIGLSVHMNPILGAFIFTSICGAMIEYLRSVFEKYADLVLSIILSLSVGIAITIISSGKLRTNAEAYMFGSILTITKTDLYMAIGLSVLAVVTLIVLYHQMIYIAFDEEAAIVAGVKVKWLKYAFSVLVASAISVSIRIVGMLALSAMISIPVATALQLDKGFKWTLLFSIAFSAADILLGLFLSFYLNVAPGGFTALVSVIVLMLVVAAKKVLRTYKKRGLQNNGASDIL